MMTLCAAVAVAASTAGAPVHATPHFTFHSDLQSNLNDALIQAGDARKRGKPELFRSGDEAACFEKLPPTTRAGWDAAVDYYAKFVSPGEWTGREQYLIRVALVGFDEQIGGDDDRNLLAIVQAFRAAATPAYRSCRWTAQDEKNRKWIADLGPKLADTENELAQRLETLYRKTWSGLPIRVDIVEVVNWSGANSILRKQGGGHLMVSTGNLGDGALEVVFHEASHVLMDRNDPVRRALDDAASAAGWPQPGDLWHVVLFYTTGEAVRRVLADGGKPGYTPMLEGIYRRGTWTAFREPLENVWGPYVRGERDLKSAAAALVDELRQREAP